MFPRGRLILAALLLVVLSASYMEVAGQAIEPLFQFAGRIVVAKRGGDFTSITDALAAIHPSAQQPFVIDVMPGEYRENIRMKSFVSLRGAGAGIVTLTGDGSAVIIVDRVSNVEISGFTISAGSGNEGILVKGSSPVIRDNEFTENSGAGIFNINASPTIVNNTIRNSGGPGISNNRGSSPVIVSNRIINNSGAGIFCAFSDALLSGTFAANTILNNEDGVFIESPADMIVSGNTIANNRRAGVLIVFSDAAPTLSNNAIVGNRRVGVSIRVGASPTVSNNRITGNGTVGDPLDISVQDASTPNISFNVYDALVGTTGVGKFNVNSAGEDATPP